ncbi:hypothetical protein XENORESO_016538 [Xenotaenia resolanae]|uniref:Uncharacterized protein n=1 Tax=Xenotaenia resolanae TaxID=208358 RepID=A0ABV0WT43_9TELE
MANLAGRRSESGLLREAANRLEEIKRCKYRVHVGENDYVHLMIFQSPLLGNTIETQFLGVQGDHKLEDHLEPFEPSSLNEYLD